MFQSGTSTRVGGGAEGGGVAAGLETAWSANWISPFERLGLRNEMSSSHTHAKKYETCECCEDFFLDFPPPLLFFRPYGDVSGINHGSNNENQPSAAPPDCWGGGRGGGGRVVKRLAARRVLQLFPNCVSLRRLCLPQRCGSHRPTNGSFNWFMTQTWWSTTATPLCLWPRHKKTKEEKE